MKAPKPKINISQSIRDILANDPDAKPADIVQILEEQHNVTVTPQYVSTIKSNTKRHERTTVSPGLENLVLAKEFIRSAGGFDEAVQLLRDYQSLVE